MSKDDPFFPTPDKAKASYREPGRKLLASEKAEVRVAEDEDGGEKRESQKPKVVELARSNDDLELMERASSPKYRRDRKTGEALESDRQFWHRVGFYASYPRFSGAVMVVIGGILLYFMLTHPMEAHHSARIRRAQSPAHLLMSAAPLMFTFGLWSVIAGYPLSLKDELPSWWKAGALVSFVVGFVLMTYLFLFTGR